ncbi:unnamed protein product [Symbiodinium sp. CCMP2592]|nr:unnamed protein product [Symbiodinium sp. CCMP2592]
MILRVALEMASRKAAGMTKSTFGGFGPRGAGAPLRPGRHPGASWRHPRARKAAKRTENLRRKRLRAELKAGAGNGDAEDLAALKQQLAKLWDREPDEQAGETGPKLQPCEQDDEVNAEDRTHKLHSGCCPVPEETGKNMPEARLYL